MKKILYFVILVFFCCEQKKETFYESIYGDKLYKEGEDLIQKDNLKAYLKFQQAIVNFKKQKDSSKISKSLIYQSIAQNYTGDILGSEATLVEALNYMKGDDESYYSVYGSLGNLKYDQKEYIEAEKFFTKALQENFESFDEKANLMNNKSASQYRLGKYTQALNTLKRINQSKISNVYLINRIKENTIYVKWLINNNYPAQKEFENLLNIKLKNDDLWGLNSSYSHLAELNQNTNAEKSLFYAKKMLKNAIKIKSPEDRLEAMERIFPVDNPINLKKNFTYYKSLSDSVQRSRNDYRKSFAYIKYDSEKKEIENQKLKLDKVENKNQILKQYFGLGSLSFLLFGGFFWYKKRRKRLQQEKELEVKNTELKMSKKVHDKVANKVYHVMSEVENTVDMNKEVLLYKLDGIYQISRDISYEKSDTVLEHNFSQHLSQMLKSYSSEKIKVPIIGNEEQVWEGISDSSKVEIFYVLQELMTNMKKHSNADKVLLDFERKNDEIQILYSDNGIGITTHSPKNGLRNTESRINSIGGTITFDTKTENGLKVTLSFPAKN